MVYTMKNSKEDSQIFNLNGEYARLDKFFEPPASTIIELDLGCGKGAFSTALARKYPETMVFSVDVMIGRLRKLVKRKNRENIANMFLLRGEASFFVTIMLPDSSVDRLHILFPDPWPKNKHRGNRLVSSEFLGQIHRVLKDGGVFHFATDDDSYYKSVTSIVGPSGIFREEPSAISDLSDIKTDFERRWLEEDRAVNHMSWVKLPKVFRDTAH
ncbi:MAG: hypothetical protein A2020_05245 [Lentisphaerae bacterium GWF2_45_14]|nr:MAG: hypothetical protein A2020_05245 [Lentisphaerae bacterium GWF2_45_14]